MRLFFCLKKDREKQHRGDAERKRSKCGKEGFNNAKLD
jgi:hypothetical protein